MAGQQLKASTSSAAVFASRSLGPDLTRRTRTAWRTSLEYTGHLVTAAGNGPGNGAGNGAGHAGNGRIRPDARMDAEASIRHLQRSGGLPETGVIDEATRRRLLDEVSHRHVLSSRVRIATVQEMLASTGFAPEEAEASARAFGASSQDAVRRFQEAAGITDGVGLITDATLEALRRRALTARLSTRTQTAKLQRAVLRAARIRRLPVAIDAQEMKSRTAGASTQAAVRALQESLGLPVTGEVDPTTFQQIASVAASRAQLPAVGRPDPSDLTTVPRVLRLNMSNKSVPQLQKTLAFLGHRIDERELKATTFGPSTRRAVLAYQASARLAQTGAADVATLRSLNARVAAANPAAAVPSARIRGSVRDASWNGMRGVLVRLSTNPLRGDAVPLGSRTTRDNGFYDLPYTAPIDPATGRNVTPLHLRVTFTATDGALLGTEDLLDPTSIAWANLTLGDYPYQGPSRRQVMLAAVAVAAAGIADVATLFETAEHPEVSRVAKAAQLTQDDVMRLVLAARAAVLFAQDPASAQVDAEVCFAFLAQSLPASLPDDLLAQTHDWALIDQLVALAARGIAFLDPAVADGALDAALSANLVPVTLAARRQAVREALLAARRRFALSEPLLPGNGTLRGLLAASAVPAAAYPVVADVFVSSGGIGERFWSALHARAAEVGGDAALESLRTASDVGSVTKNFDPMSAAVRAAFSDPGRPDLNGPRDLARLTVQQWDALIPPSDTGVPPGTDGATTAERRATYARTLASQSERIFPTVAVTAQVARGGALQHIGDISAIVDQHPDLVLRTANIDVFAQVHAIALEPEVHTELRVLQRVHRLAPTAGGAAALLEAGLHSSVQLVSVGPGEVVRRLGEQGLDQRTALTIHGYAKFQYAQVLQRLGEFRSELQAATPAALAPRVITAEDRAQLLGQVPDLELLFGPVDVCDCPHCASVYGPAAYLADLLRFLDAHPAATGGGTVRGVLAARRPDLAGLELSCVNTDTALPHIDLVNEILEAAVAGTPPQPTQTTWSAHELRATPEHTNAAAYEILRTADVPIAGGFDLWQEQTRTHLTQLGVPRWALMRTYGAAADGPAALSDIAAEYFGIASHEAGLILTPAVEAAKQTTFWGFDATRTTIPVPDLLAHGGLGYPHLLLTLQTRIITPPGDPRVVLARPPDSADLSQQTVRNVSPGVLDRLGRLLRLARHTPWDLWDLDLLLAAERLGAARIDADALVALRGAAEVGQRLAVNAERLAGWFGTIPVAGRPSAADPSDDSLRARSPYARTFLDRAVLTPPDPGLELPLGGGPLSAHRPALLGALAVTDAELDALLAVAGATLDLATMSRLAAWSQLAAAMRLRVGELLALATLLRPLVPDPFATPAAMLAFLDAARVRTSSTAVAELDYLLHARPNSAFAPSDDAVTASLAVLRESLRTNPAAAPQGQVAVHLAGVLGTTVQDTARLLARDDGGGPMLAAFVDPELVRTDATGAYTHPLAPGTFPRAYVVFRRLRKAARAATVLGLSGDALAWTLAHAADIGGLDLAALPVDTEPANSLVPGWLALTAWVALEPRLSDRAAKTAAAAAAVGAGGGAPVAAAVAAELIAAASPGAPIGPVRDLAASMLGIDPATLAAFDAGAATAYRDTAVLTRLLEAADQAARIGVTPATCRSWALREHAGGPTEAAIAIAVRGAAKAKYDPQAWLTFVTPVQDTLRERQRDGLLAHLLERSVRTQPESVTIDGRQYANPAYWRSPDDVLTYYLVDVEMSSCQLTSRVKQAIGSVQMFVQRAFLNLEKPRVVVSAEERADRASLDSWRQWRWMKSYRLWEANRKIFLYPENWIQPELRDDKTPFFVELEQELLQGDVTDENAETALGHYLEKLEEVANLEVAGIYHEIDDDNPYDNLPPTVNLVHVVARSRTVPVQHWYRSYDVNTALWSAWERIDLDIVGPQVVPVVYNRVLHLFWLQIEEKPQKANRQPAAQPTAGTKPSPEAPRQMEITLSWSTRQSAGWTKRQVAAQPLVHPWQRPASSYTLRPRYSAADNQLLLDLYVSTTAQFNNRQFWDPFAGNHAYVTNTRFNETLPAWLSSTFVFDGRLVAVRLKPLTGRYHLAAAGGSNDDTLADTDSYAYVRALTDPTGRWVTPMQPGQKAGRLAAPDGMHLEAGRMVNNGWWGHTTWLSVLENAASVPLLTAVQPPFSLVQSPHRSQYDTGYAEHSPFFFVDAMRAYVVRTSSITVSIDSTRSVQRLQHTFSPFTHPYAALFLRELNRSGVDGLLNRKIQRFPEQYPPGRRFDFAAYAPVAPTAVADAAAAHDTLDFSRSGAMSAYNWELFFHVPFLVSCKLMANQRFEEAMTWFHRIFDPTNTEALSAPQRFWVTKPFFDQTDDDYRKQRIESLLADIGDRLDEVRAWKNNPFVPDAIARFRPVAYQKAVVMRYIDNLVAWGDQLFRRDTIESINEATMLYLLAAELLGRRPEHVPAPPRPAQSYDGLVAGGPLDAFGNTVVEVQLENFTDHPTVVFTDLDGDALPVMHLQYFGIPANDQLLAYWDTVADRLFKIRNCMNLAGTVRQLDLFEPPIDPAALVRAAAAGVDLGSVLNDTGAVASPYRFRTLHSRAIELASDVRILGDRMLALLDRRDAEGMAQLFASNETSLQTSILDVRTAQVTEAGGARSALELGRNAIQARIDYYSGIPRMNDWETAATIVHGIGIASQIVSTVLSAVGGGASLVPTFTVGAAGFGGSPVAVVSYGGGNVGNSLSMFAGLFQGVSQILHSGAQMLESQGTYQRVHDTNQHQSDLASKELAQLEGQIAAAMLREATAGYELSAQQTSLDGAKAVDDYLRTKYTSAELLDWTIAQLSTVYFQAYQLAYELAQQSEQAYRYELADESSAPVIRFGYWDSLKKGLLAGDRLLNDLRRLDAAYLERNTRRLEAVTHVSLATLMPERLLELTTTGTTTVDLAEWIFAMEHPGWIDQRIQSVAVSVPCSSGPWVGVHAGLTLTKAVVRASDAVGGGGFGDALNDADDRFRAAMSPVRSIVTSHGSVDRGLLDSGAGVGDDRYTAFEGAGLISRWTLTLDPRDNAFDLSTVTDVVLHVEYSGEPGGPALVDAARRAADDAVPATGQRLFDLLGGYPAQWHRFGHPAAGAPPVLELYVTADDLMFRHRRAARTKRLTAVGADLVVLSAHTGQFDVRVGPPGVTLPGNPPSTTVPMPKDATFGGMHHAAVTWPVGQRDLLGGWQFQVKRDSDADFVPLPDAVIENAWLLLRFEIQ